MALADLDPPPAGYIYDGTYLPDGSLATRYIGGGALPTGYNSGGFNPDGSLRWASNAMASPDPAVTNPLIRTPAPVAPRFNLSAMFSPVGPNSLGRYGAGGGSVVPGGSAGRAPMAQAPLRPTMSATSKSGAIQSAVNQATTTRTANAGQEQQSLAEYAKAMLQGQPKAKQYADEETAAMSQIYGRGSDSLEAQLAALNRREQSATNIAAQNAMSRARRGINAMRVQGGGGNSSYLDRLMAEQLYGIGVDAAGRGAQQGRADLTWLTGQRQGAAGRRQSILDTLAQRGLAPVFANQQVEAGGLANLGRVADLEYGNNIYERPEDEWRRRLEFLNYLGGY